MTPERFNQLLGGPLHHPIPMFQCTRLALALKDVVEATGLAGEKALEDHCRVRDAVDKCNEDPS